MQDLLRILLALPHSADRVIIVVVLGLGKAVTVSLLLVAGPIFSLIWPILAQLAVGYGALTQSVLLLVESVALLEGHVSLGIFLILILIELDQIRRIGEAAGILLVDLARLVRVEVLGREVYILWIGALAIELLGLE